MNGTGAKRGGWRHCLMWAVAFLVGGIAGRATALDVPLVFTQEPVDGGAGSRVVLLQQNGEVRVLTAGFAAAGDPCVSFSGEQVLFAARLRDGDPWNIWIMDADGSRQRQLTREMGDCREPVFLVRAAVDAPNFADRVRWFAFTSTAPGVLDERGRGDLTALYAMNLQPLQGRGTVVWRITHGLGGDIAPMILEDGRVLYSSWQREGYALMAVTWAGECPNPFCGTHDGRWSQLSACEARADRRVVFVERQGDSGDRSGRLAEVSLRRPLHSHSVLSGEEDGRYRSPHVLPDGRLLVSYAEKQGDYGLYLFDRKRQGPGRRIYDDPRWHDVDPQPVVEREEPVSRIPMVEFASVLDVSGYENAGQLQCMNVYETDRPEVAGIPEGAVHAVRLMEGLPLTRQDAKRVGLEPGEQTGEAGWPPPFVRTRSLGEAPVEPDGSFYVNVAGNVPFYVQTLGAEGNVLHTMRAWTWVRNRNQRGCIGCHEDKELAPVNRATQALIKAEPRNLMGPGERDKGED